MNRCRHTPTYIDFVIISVIFSLFSLTGLEDESQTDLENYQSIVDRFVHFKPKDKGTSQVSERRRMPGTASQGTGSAGIGKSNSVHIYLGCRNKNNKSFKNNCFSLC